MVILSVDSPATRPVVMGVNGMVASSHSLTFRAGLSALLKHPARECRGFATAYRSGRFWSYDSGQISMS